MKRFIYAVLTVLGMMYAVSCTKSEKQSVMFEGEKTYSLPYNSTEVCVSVIANCEWEIIVSWIPVDYDEDEDGGDLIRKYIFPKYGEAGETGVILTFPENEAEEEAVLKAAVLSSDLSCIDEITIIQAAAPSQN